LLRVRRAVVGVGLPGADADEGVEVLLVGVGRVWRDFWVVLICA
jgi:hypothetical protein